MSHSFRSTCRQRTSQVNHLKHHLELQQRRIYAMKRGLEISELCQINPSYPINTLTASARLDYFQTQDSSHIIRHYSGHSACWTLLPFAFLSCTCVALHVPLAAHAPGVGSWKGQSGNLATDSGYIVRLSSVLHGSLCQLGGFSAHTMADDVVKS